MKCGNSSLCELKKKINTISPDHREDVIDYVLCKGMLNTFYLMRK